MILPEIIHNTETNNWKKRRLKQKPESQSKTKIKVNEISRESSKEKTSNQEKRKLSFNEKREFEQLKKEIPELEKQIEELEELLNSGSLPHDELY